jgi:hypothetical protein
MESSWLIGGTSGYALYGVTQSGAVVWTSRDGLTWNQADFGVAGHSWTYGVWSLQDRFVVYGQICSEEGCRRQLWSSGDGIDWVERDDETIRWLDIEQRPVGWRGGALIFGWKAVDERNFEPYVWASADGLTWEMEPLDNAGPGNDIVPFSNGLFETSVEHDNLEDRDRAFTWTSTDGLSWEQHEWPLDAFPTLRDEFLVASFGDGALLITDAVWKWVPAN